MRAAMPSVREEHGLDMLFMMLGDREANLTHIPFCGEGAKEVAEGGFQKCRYAAGVHRHCLHFQQEGTVRSRHNGGNRELEEAGVGGDT